MVTQYSIEQKESGAFSGTLEHVLTPVPSLIKNTHRQLLCVLWSSVYTAGVDIWCGCEALLAAEPKDYESGPASTRLALCDNSQI